VLKKVGYATGTCPRCGKTLIRRRPASVAVCDCWMYCPLCGGRMEAYTPPSDLRQYEAGDLDTVMICRNHTPPYKSKVKPVEVKLQ